MRDSLLHVLPALTFMLQTVGAARCFVPDRTARDGRSGLIVFSFLGMLAASSLVPPRSAWFVFAGVAGLAAALGLFLWAAHSIRGRHFSYVFSSDVPQFLHETGPYAWIRNPFYTSYLLALGSTALLFPSASTVAIAVAMVGYFHWAARFEERKFESSALGADYLQYKARTGRFVPHLRAPRRPSPRLP